MKIKIQKHYYSKKSQIKPGQLQAVTSSLRDAEFCCASLKCAVFDGAYVGFGDYSQKVYNTDMDINIYAYSAYNDNRVEEVGIRFCPFCGEKIEITEITDKIQTLNNPHNAEIERLEPH